MLKKQVNSMTATKLRVILICCIMLLFVLSAAVFWFFRTQLEAYASQVQTDTAAATISTKDVARLQELQRKLQEDKIAVTRAKNIVADSKYYQYQDQIISDITTYARNAGVTITSFTFNTDTAGSVGAVGGAPTQSLPPTGLKTTTASIAIKFPVSYINIMNFVHSIEINLTKMQLSGISISRTAGGNVQINPITIEVYIR